MTDQEPQNPEDELRRLFEQFLQGAPGVNPESLAGAAGLPIDFASLSLFVNQLQQSMRSSDGKIDWTVAKQQAMETVKKTEKELNQNLIAAYDQSAKLSELWLADTTTLPLAEATNPAASRSEWIERTLPTWAEISEPVAKSIASAIAGVIEQQAPSELAAMLPNAQQLVTSVGGALFAMQLGQVVGQLSQEVVSGGDVGIPLVVSGEPMLLPQNILEFAEGLDTPIDQIMLYLNVRELAHATVFKNAKWLRLNFISLISEHAKGFKIDPDQIFEISENFNPTNAEEVREILISGSLIPEKTEEQKAVLTRLETLLALIEGWVELVTEQACSRLPNYPAIAESFRRRRAAGGPAEAAFSTLVGLEIKPKLLREATELWRLVEEKFGKALRDSLWSQPDLLPSTEELNTPELLIARLSADNQEQDDFDSELQKLLAEQAESSSEEPEKPEPKSEEPNPKSEKPEPKNDEESDQS